MIKKVLSGLLAALVALAPLGALATDRKPLVIISGVTQQIPSTDTILAPATATTNASLRLPHGTAPSAPNDGDMWTTTAGIYARINGSTVGPLGTGSGSITGSTGSTDEVLLRADGTGGSTLQGGGVISLSDTGVLTFPDNIRQTFNPGADAAGINVGARAGDPGTLSDGDVWYNSSTNKLRGRENSVTYSLVPSQVLISEQSPSATGTVTFSSIEAIYRDLYLVIRGRGTTAATTVSVAIRLNSDSGANYDRQRVSGANATASASSTVAATDLFALTTSLPAASATADVAGAIDVTIFDYRGTTFQKAAKAVNNVKFGTTTADLSTSVISGYWRSTAAVTRVDVILSAGNFVSGSVVSLYGVY